MSPSSTPGPLGAARDGRARLPRDPDVVVAEDVRGEALDELGRRFVVVQAPDAWSDPGRLAELLGGARALVVRNRTRVTADLLRASPALEVVARAGAGLDNVDVGAADEIGVVVTAASGANATSVAEMALGLALALARRIAAHDRQVRAGDWERTPGRELAGGTWGVVGFGSTGRATARLARACGMTVCVHDPFQAPTGRDLRGAVATSLADLLARSDVVSLHLAGSDETDGMVDEGFLTTMRNDAFLVNVARGSLVDEAALLRALDRGAIAGAALDVRRQEPPGDDPPAAALLAQHPNVVSTPHVGGITSAAQDRVVAMIGGDVARVLDGDPAEHAAGIHRRPARPR